MTITHLLDRTERARSGAGPMVVGHRGACGYRPEHTLASYELAARMGADSLEPDLVASRDHVLICRHDLELSRTTDVADRPEFADRRATRAVDGNTETGWFVSDFTVAELKTLWARERFASLRQPNTIYEGRLRIATFDELLALRARLSAELGRSVGLSPELKSPELHRSLGLDLEAPLVRALREADLDRPDAPVFVQTFEPRSLLRLRKEHGLSAPTIMLTEASGGPADLTGVGSGTTYADLTTPAMLDKLAPWLTGIGPAKDQVIPRRADGSLGGPSRLVRDAHALGLRVHVWTFRAENAFLPTGHRSSGGDADFGHVLDEMRIFLQAGVDALITDHVDLAALARSEIFQ
ncbi:glycerophosphoryl diester phosphodiesterase [Flexivirga endophytica]|uniref:glycerophosphodiester phosphodiesterase n=1 Tax=Flexivirga endophytica TaxID=1849103 RepID=A0A916WZI4_9MICO|nr:glycerophosphodiester phosphodiesterase family protein [Flexivirga endophytica]GGB41662.1 glycerophosphoryl diester phosphodiesterase [Flexivirga endophytica]GHB49501.1 glycerophosphoryl diester phosphodiesterase [Flexivirga endophytica]